MSCLKIAQQQCELIYLREAWRGQHFFHAFEKSLSGRKWTSRNCCIMCTWVGIVSVCELCVSVCVCVTVLQDLCEVVGSVVRNGPIGQRLQEAQHWHGLWVLGALDLLMLTDDDRRTHFSGSLGRKHIRHQVKFTIGRQQVPANTGRSVTDRENTPFQ